MILNRQRRVPVTIEPLKKFAERARGELGFPPEGVSVRLISDSAMSRLNSRFRGKRGSTDVLSFPVRHRAPKRPSARRPRADAELGGYVGDIAISPETARRNARRFSRSLQTELRILILHGMIHLAGFDHEADHGQMERLERRLQSRLGLR